MADVELVPGNTLLVPTPEEGRALAMMMARRTVKTTQPDDDARARQRDVYANDPAMLIALTQTVAIEFSTIAAANNYWR